MPTPEEILAEEKKKQEERMKKLEDGLSSVTAGISELTKGMKSFTAQISTTLEALKKEPDDPKKKKQKPSDYALETMSRAEFLDTIVKVVDDKLGEHKEGISQSLTSTTKKIDESELATQIKEVMKDHPDFWEWKDEMAFVARQAEGLPVRDVYMLAKARNPEKAKTLESKAKEEAEKKRKEEVEAKTEEEKKAMKERAANPIFGGLLPTSGRTEESQKMGKEEAGELAWEKTFGASPNV